MSRWIKFLIAVIVGIALGLVYGWVLSPVEYVDVAPGSLRNDYRYDTVLMVAGIYATDGDADSAARQLTLLGSEPPAEIAVSSLRFGYENNYPNTELTTIQQLVTALQTWQPAGVAP